MNYEEIVDYIDNIPKFGVSADGRNKSGNENLLRVLQELGNPHKKSRAIHIAGTNGKGSTVSFIKEMLRVRGFSVGVFTSPHLVRINERICFCPARQTDGGACEITDEEFAECFEKVKHVIDRRIEAGYMHLSYFEMLFAMAAVFFEEKGPDYVVYETGLGGRLDATNLLAPAICGITSIGLDHEKYLGNTIRDIAYEKAGIIKKGVPVVYNTGSLEADSVIREIAAKTGSKEINVAKTEYFTRDITDKTIDFSIKTSYYNYDNLRLKDSYATYQTDNAATAIVLCNELFGEENYLTEDEINLALDNFFWPGRMEEVAKDVIVDGAHNLDAIERFVEACSAIEKDRELSLFFAVAEDKDYEPMIDAICGHLKLSAVYVTSLDSSRGISADYVAAIFKHYLSCYGQKNTLVAAEDNISECFDKARKYSQDRYQRLYCAGSLYLVGDIKKLVSKEIKHD